VLAWPLRGNTIKIKRDNTCGILEKNPLIHKEVSHVCF